MPLELSVPWRWTDVQMEMEERRAPIFGERSAVGQAGCLPIIAISKMNEKHLVPAPFERLAHPALGFAPVVFPAVIEKRHAAVDGFVDDLDGCRLVRRISKMVPAQAEGGNHGLRLAKFLYWNGAYFELLAAGEGSTPRWGKRSPGRAALRF